MTPPACPVPGRWVLDELAGEIANPDRLGPWLGPGGHCGGGVYDWGGPVGPCALEWEHDGECKA